MTLNTFPCRSCQAPITMVRTSSGGWMPLRPEPDPVGNVRLVKQDGVLFADVITSEYARANLYPGETWYRPHWADCPDAPSWRKS